MSFIAVAVLFIAACAAIGLTRERAHEVRLVATLAAFLICAQFALLLTR